MDSSSIDLPGSEIERITLDRDLVTIHFSRAIIIQTMSGSKERTRWWQAGDLIFEGAEASGEIPEGPLVCAGGDVGENVYTYRDMIPIPLVSRGSAHCDLRFQGTEQRLIVRATAVRLEMKDRPRYIEHIRPE